RKWATKFLEFTKAPCIHFSDGSWVNRTLRECGCLVKYRLGIVKRPALPSHCRPLARVKVKVVGTRRVARVGHLNPGEAEVAGDTAGRPSHFARRPCFIPITYSPISSRLFDSFGVIPTHPGFMLESRFRVSHQWRLPIGMKRTRSARKSGLRA